MGRLYQEVVMYENYVMSKRLLQSAAKCYISLAKTKHIRHDDCHVASFTFTSRYKLVKV